MPLLKWNFADIALTIEVGGLQEVLGGVAVVPSSGVDIVAFGTAIMNDVVVAVSREDEVRIGMEMGGQVVLVIDPDVPTRSTVALSLLSLLFTWSS